MSRYICFINLKHFIFINGGSSTQEVIFFSWQCQHDIHLSWHKISNVESTQKCQHQAKEGHIKSWIVPNNFLID
jgi:hypothetical protein